jgi:replicative DNA helicase
VKKKQYDAAKSGKVGVFFSLEMAADQIVQRMISLDAEIDLQRIKRKDLYQDERIPYDRTLDRIKKMPIVIDDNSALNIFKLKTKLTKIKKEQGLDFVVIDYLQLMTGMDKDSNRNEELDYISRQLKAIAKEFKVPIIALSQLSRAVESRALKIPMLSDLRESGGIEHNADIVCFIYRGAYYGINQDEQGNDISKLANFIIAKHRNGEVGDINLGWNGSWTKFYDLLKPSESNNLSPNIDFTNETPF